MIEMTTEQALQWAYGTELPRLNAATEPAVRSAWDLIASSISNGFAGSGSVWTGGPDPASSEPHPAALALHAAVVELRADGAPDAPADSLVFGLEGFSLDPHQAFADAWAKVGLDIIRHAKLKSRPSLDSRPRPRAFRYLNGSVQVLKPASIRQKRDRQNVYVADVPVAATRKGNYDPGAFCPLRWSPRPDHTLRDRAEYAAWVTALLAIRKKVSSVSSLSAKVSSALKLIRDDIDDTPWIAMSSKVSSPDRRVFHNEMSDQKLRDENVLKAAQSLRLRGVARI